MPAKDFSDAVDKLLKLY